jgi:hypothetical protein
VFQLINRLVRVTPSSAARVIDAGAGNEQRTDAGIDRLFDAR